MESNRGNMSSKMLHRCIEVMTEKESAWKSAPRIATQRNSVVMEENTALKGVSTGRDHVMIYVMDTRETAMRSIGVIVSRSSEAVKQPRRLKSEEILPRATWDPGGWQQSTPTMLENVERMISTVTSPCGSCGSLTKQQHIKMMLYVIDVIIATLLSPVFWYRSRSM